MKNGGAVVDHARVSELIEPQVRRIALDVPIHAAPRSTTLASS
jgi:hypothetical protein